MATEKVALIKCDSCGRVAHTYHVQTPDGQRFQVDLCDDDAKPLLKLIAQGRRVSRMPRANPLLVSPRPDGL